MADEQPNTPLEGAQAPDGAAPEPVSDESREGSSPGWWSRLFNRRPAPEVSTEDGEPGTAGSTSEARKLTQEELDRQVQSEVDRREAKRAAEERAKARKELRDKDPWAYAEQERTEEQVAQGNNQLTQWLAGIGAEHDKVSIDPIFLALPETERDRIRKIEGAGVGLDGRKLVVNETLKSLEKHWRAEGAREAEQRLRRNAAFRKQVLAEARGQAVEPDLLPALTASEADQTVSDRLRSFYHIGNHNELKGR